jgi:hypothetical protein
MALLPQRALHTHTNALTQRQQRHGAGAQSVAALGSV